ncbi:uncharacterized protein C20orf96 homolog isoform X3 [Heterocephalus glaber]|uniref:Uncharacterized protein C20orf96 homolog isoform X3 n=1 Tax=Heterocephalus glaber TaxID=10181 RepID=A0AAX6SPY9_HETGA|nr:uncharacterized protein C20orf96 homolog isoform X3 [Heterocephalus glaber]
MPAFRDHSLAPLPLGLASETSVLGSRLHAFQVCCLQLFGLRMTKILSHSNSFQTQPLGDSLHGPQFPVSVPSKLMPLETSQLKNPQGRIRQKPHLGKIPAKPRLMRMMLQNQRSLLQDVCDHECFLTKQNEGVVRTILDMEASTALQVRAILRQEDISLNMMDILEYSNNKLQRSKSELQEWREKEEWKKNSLEQQAEQLNTRIKNMQELVSFLSTYMEHKYSLRSVQIASLVCQLQQVKDSQQPSGLAPTLYLPCIAAQEEAPRDRPLLCLQKTQYPHDKTLQQVIWDSWYQQKWMVKCRELIDQSKEKMPTLRADVEVLRTQVQDLQEVIFEDVLLQRPKCTPDMDIILNIPVEELLPF